MKTPLSPGGWTSRRDVWPSRSMASRAPPHPPRNGGQWWRADARRCWTVREEGAGGCLRVAVRRWDRDVDTTVHLREVWVASDERDGPPRIASTRHANSEPPSAFRPPAVHSGGDAVWDDAGWDERQLDLHLEEEAQQTPPVEPPCASDRAPTPGAEPRAAPPPRERRYVPVPSAGVYAPLPWDEGDPDGARESRLRTDAVNHPWCQTPSWQGRQHLPLRAAQREAREAASADLRPGPTAPLRRGSAPPSRRRARARA